MKKKLKWQQYGILNAFGSMWTPKTFETIAEAERYMEAFWGGIKDPPDMSKHKVVIVNVSVSKRRPKSPITKERV